MTGPVTRRPTVTAVGTLAIAIAGAYAWRGLPIAALPETRPPRALVTALRPATGPEEMEALVGAPVEAAARRVRGVRGTRTLSEERSGWAMSIVEVELDEGARARYAWLELRESLAALRRSLPGDVRGPSLHPYASPELGGLAEPPLRVLVAGPLGPRELRRVARERVVPALRGVAGAAAAALEADPPRVLDVAVRQGATLPADVEEVAAAVRESRRAGWAGTVRAGALQHAVTLAPDEPLMADVAGVRPAAGRPTAVTVADVAEIRIREPRPDRLLRVDGDPAEAVVVRRERDARARQLAQAVGERLRTVRLPPGVSVAVEADERDSPGAPRRLLIARLGALAFALALLVAVSTRDTRATLGVLASAAAATLAGVAVLRATGGTLNVMSGAGLALGATLAVHDAARVVHTVRWQRRRHARRTIAPRAATDAWPPSAASALVTLAALLPLLYLDREWRAYCVPLAVACAATRGASALLCVGIVPWAARGMRHRPRSRCRRGAAVWLLAHALRRPGVVLAVALLLAAAAGWRVLAARLAPPSGEGADPGDVIEASVAFARGTALEATDSAVRPLERRLRLLPGVRRVTAEVRAARALLRVHLDPTAHGGEAAERVRERVAAEGRRLGGARTHVSGGVGGSRGTSPAAYRLAVRGPELERVRSIAEGIAARVRREPRTAEVEANAGDEWGAGDRAVELVLRPDREALARAGLSAGEVVRTAAAAAGGAAGWVQDGGARLLLRVGVGGEGALGEAELLRLPVPGGGAATVGELARAEWGSAPGRVVREDQRYERVVSWEYRGPPRLGERVRREVLASTHLPPGYALAAVDERAIEGGAAVALWAAAGVGLLLVGMVVAAWLESVPLALLLMPVAPAALAGALLPVALLGVPLAREAQLGAVLVAALAAAGAADVVRRARSLAGRGGGRAAQPRAALRAAHEHAGASRPAALAVLLAALATTLCGPGGATERALEWVIAGGVAAAWPLAVVVAPAIFLLHAGRPRRA